MMYVLLCFCGMYVSVIMCILVYSYACICMVVCTCMNECVYVSLYMYVVAVVCMRM